MHRNAAAMCMKHVVKGLNDVMGRRPTKTLRVSNVVKDTSGTYTCYCGKSADYYILEVQDEQKNSAGGEKKQANSNAG